MMGWFHRHGAQWWQFQVSGEILIFFGFFAATFHGISMYFVGEHRGEDSMGFNGLEINGEKKLETPWESSNRQIGRWWSYEKSEIL